MSGSSFTRLNVRRGTPADIPFIAWCNYEASSPAPGFCYWDPLLEGLNTPTIKFIEAMFHAKALAWGDPHDFFIAELDGEPVGGASGFEMNPDDYRPLRDAQIPEIAKRLGWDDQTLASFRERYQEIWRDPTDVSIAPAAPWTIECVATKPDFRGKGIAGQILHAILVEGKGQGYKNAGISVTMGNEPAQHVYEKLGFQHYMSYGSEYFDGQFPGTIKYRMGLDNLSDEVTVESRQE